MWKPKGFRRFSGLPATYRRAQRSPLRRGARGGKVFRSILEKTVGETLWTTKRPSCRRLTGYAASEPVIGRAIIEEVAETFDMLPRADRGRQMGEEREAPARIFSAAGRAELWAAGAAEPVTTSSMHKASVEAPRSSFEETSPSLTSTRHEESRGDASHAPDAEEIGAAFRRSGLSGDISNG